MILFFSIFVSSSFIGFDIGSETIKAAAIRSGRSIEIILNEQSKRKTPGLVSFEPSLPITVENIRNITRRVGFSATSVLLRNQTAVVRAIPEILGKQISPELQSHLDKRYYNFKMNGTLVNGIEPHVVLAMLLDQFVHHAESQLQQGNIRDAVIAVPSFFTDLQRNRVAQAAKVAGLNLIQIIDEKHALALVYALEKTSFFTRESKTIAIVDVGHSSITISGFKFSAKIVTQKGRSPRPVPKVEELGYVWDDTIGGIDFDVSIAKYLSQKYNKPMTQVLIEDSQKIKHALSLNDVANITVDSFDHKVILTRSEFEQICEPILTKIVELAKSINKTFDSVEFVGGASRIPIVTEKISSILGPSSRSLNGDEAIVMGAAYTAAMSSGAFKLMDVSHDPTSVHSANLTYGSKDIRLFSIGSSLTKMKTARLDADNNQSRLVLSYSSRIPVGSEKLIGEWEIMKPNNEDYPPVSRLAISFSFNEKTRIMLTKSQLFTKLESGEVKQSIVDVKRTSKPLKISKEEKLREKILLNAFSSNDVRLAKVAEARNTLESLLFELRESHQHDPIWLKVMSSDEKTNVNKTLKEVVDWLDSHSEFEDESVLKQKTKELEDSVKNIKYRVQEARSRESTVSELEYMLNDMQDAVLNRWPAQKLKVPKQQKKAVLNHVKMTREWLDRKLKEQEELDPWDEPTLTTKEIELRIKKLGDAFKNLEEGVLSNKLKNRRAADEDDDDDNQYGADL